MNARDDARGDVVGSRSHSPVHSPDSYAATFESDSHVGSADVNAASNGMVASAYTNKCRTSPFVTVVPCKICCRCIVTVGWYLPFRKIFCPNILDRATGLVGHLAFKKSS